jgi:tetratricopeptide (TPR) repeat protein
MSIEPHRSPRSRVKILITTGVIGVLLVAGAFAGWKVRKGLMVRAALAEGSAAYEHADWETARKMLGRYLSAHPDDVEVLAKYAHAQLSISPLPQANVSQAMSAYRRLLRVQPQDDAAFRRLALLYELTGDFTELAQIAAKRLEIAPNDPQASLAAAKALYYRQKSDDARTALEQLVGQLGSRSDGRSELVEACWLLSSLAAGSIKSGGDEASAAEARRWLDQAVAEDPNSALALAQRAALLRVLAERTQRTPSAAELEAAQDDLKKAQTLAIDDPHVYLLLSEEWLALGKFDEAAAQLEAAKHVDSQTVQEYVVDPDDWRAAQFIQAAKLTLLSGVAEDGVRLAAQTLEEFKDRPQRRQILPLTVELFVAGRRLSEAHASLDEYLEAAKLLPTTAERAEQAAYLQAVVARADGGPYRVIELLEPLADRPGARALVRGMLAEAYSQTGQTARLAKTLSQGAAERALSPDLARLLARSYLQQGAWTQAQAVLASLDEARRADVETQLLLLAAKLGAVGSQRTPETERALDGVASELTALRASHPDRADVRVLLASIAERRGQMDVAVAELRQAGAECAEPLPAVLALARLYSRTKRADEAIEVLRAACRQDGTRAAPWLALSDLLVGRQRIDEARQELQTALATTDAAAEKRRIAVALASTDILHGDPPAGLAALQRLAADDPQDIRVRGLLLGLPQVLQDAAGAQRLVDEIKAIEGPSGALWRLCQARLWLAAGQRALHRAEVEELLKYCLNADPGQIAPVLLLGGMYEQAGDSGRAEAVYASAFNVSGAPEIADRLLALLARQKRFPEARGVLEHLKQTLDEGALGARRLALALDAGQYGDALHELEARLGGQERDPLDLVRLAGVVYAQNRDAERALGYLNQAAELGADPVAVARVRVDVLKAEQRGDEAEATLAELVRTKPTPEAYLLCGWYHTSAGHPELAEQDYIKLAGVAKDALGYAVLGESYAQSKRFDEAIKAWQEGLQLYPESAPLKRGLAKALLLRSQGSDRELAGKFLAELRQALPDDTDVLWVQAVAKVGEGTTEAMAEARGLLNQALRTGPASAETYRGLAGIALQLEEYAAARDLALRSLQASSGDPDGLLLQARAELGLQNLDAARDLARAALKAEKPNLDAHAVLIEVALRTRDSSALRSELAVVQQLIRADPSREALQIARARLHVGLAESDAAIAALEEFRASDPGRGSVAVHLLLQGLYRTKGDFTTAEQRLDAVAALAPDRLDVVHARLGLLADQKRFDDLAALAQAESGGAKPRPEVLVAAATLLAGSPAHQDQAVALCRRATEVAPHDVRGYLSLGDLTYQTGDFAAAEQAFRGALRENSSQSEALNNLAWILAEQRAAYEEALGYSRKAVAARPGDANFRDTLGYVYQKSGKLEEARAEFRRGVELAPPGSPLRAKLLFHQAQVCILLQDYEPVGGYLMEALGAESAAPVFSPAEHAEIERMLQRGQSGK